MQMVTKTVTGRDIHKHPVTLQVDKLAWRPGAYGLVFNDKGQILVVENTLNHCYELPGGGVEIDERFEDAVIREVWEETGLHVEVEKFITMIDEFFLTPGGRHWHTVKGFYKCTVKSGELRNTILDDEPLENPQWVDPAILTNDNLTIGWEIVRQIQSEK